MLAVVLSHCSVGRLQDYGQSVTTHLVSYWSSRAICTEKRQGQRLAEGTQKQCLGGGGGDAHVGGIAQHLPRAHLPPRGQPGVQRHRGDSKRDRKGGLG